VAEQERDEAIVARQEADRLRGGGGGVPGRLEGVPDGPRALARSSRHVTPIRMRAEAAGACEAVPKTIRRPRTRRIAA